MKLNPKSRNILLVVVAVIVLSIYQLCTNANELFSAPPFQSLNTFNGKVIKLWRNDKDHSFWISAGNDLDKMTVYVPENCGCNLEGEIRVGETVQIRLYRSSFLSNIRAWSIQSNGREILSYKDSLAHHAGGTQEIFMAIFKIIFIVAIIAAIGPLNNVVKKFLPEKK